MAGPDNNNDGRERPRVGGVTPNPPPIGLSRGRLPAGDGLPRTGQSVAGRGAGAFAAGFPAVLFPYARSRCRDAREQHNQPRPNTTKNKNRTATPPRKPEPKKRPEPEPRRNRAIRPENARTQNEPLGQKQKNTSPLWGENRKKHRNTRKKTPGTEEP